MLNGLIAEAIKCSTFEEFEHDFLGDIKHGLYWHITDNPNFFIDPKTGPRDRSSMTMNSTPDAGKLMITSHLDHWTDYYGKSRPYAALIDMSTVPKNLYRQVNRGFGNEFFVHDISNVKVIDVMPIAKARRLDRAHQNMLPQSSVELRKIFEMAHATKPVEPDKNIPVLPPNLSLPNVNAWIYANCKFAQIVKTRPVIKRYPQTKDEDEKQEQAEIYFGLGHGEEENEFGSDPASHIVWVLDRDNNIDTAPGNKTHGMVWELCNTTWKGRYEGDSGRLSIAAPKASMNAPSWLIDKLEEKFDFISEIHEF